MTVRVILFEPLLMHVRVAVVDVAVAVLVLDVLVLDVLVLVLGVRVLVGLAAVTVLVAVLVVVIVLVVGQPCSLLAVVASTPASAADRGWRSVRGPKRDAALCPKPDRSGLSCPRDYSADRACCSRADHLSSMRPKCQTARAMPHVNVKMPTIA